MTLFCSLVSRITFRSDLRVFKNILTVSYHMVSMGESTEITEGLATVKTSGKVFYNPVQEFNRDLSISVLTVFSNEFNSNFKESTKNEGNQQISEQTEALGVKNENGITILEALSASGLRSIRYAKEIPGVKKIIANDISAKAVQDIRRNIEDNSVGDIVETSHADAIECMYSHRHQNKQVQAVDLDPYGCPSIFLDSAVQAVANGGLLLVTATDMAVLAGNSPETCHAKYGSVSLKIKSCHEMALRILLRSIESRANVYGRYIVPLLSVSADFYIRVFVKVFTGQNKCKQTTSKLSNVFHCTGCGSFTLQPLGIIKSAPEDKQIKFGLPTGPAVNSECQHCNQRHHMGGPIWSAPIHDKEFVQKVLQAAPERLGTWKRIQGVLNVILEELDGPPLYYTIEHMSSVIRSSTPPMNIFRSAILNAGYEVSYSHTNKTSVKTNAPASFLWDILRAFEAEHPVRRDRLSPIGTQILSKGPSTKVDFTLHENAEPASKRQALVRFQHNPQSYWGPGTRAKTNVVGDEHTSKKKRNQNKHKRKRDVSNESTEKVESKKLETEN